MDIQFGSIGLESKSGVANGTLRLSEDISWSPSSGGSKKTLNKSDIKDWTICRVGKVYRLTVFIEGGGAVRFSGFVQSDLDSLKDYSSSILRKELMEEVQSTSGKNWGDVELTDSFMVFSVEGNRSWDMPLSSINNSTLNPKTGDISIEFKEGFKDGDELVELTLHVPGTTEAMKFNESLVQKADIVPNVGDAIYTFESLPLITPRGRYQIDLYATFIRLHGKTHQYKIPFSNIVKMYLLHKTEQEGTYFIIVLDAPLRQGQTYYPHVIFNMKGEDMLEMETNVSDEVLAELKKRGIKKPDDRLSGTATEVLSSAFSQLSGKKVIGPGGFRTNENTSFVRCSYKSNEGELFLLAKAFFFLYKPSLILPYDEVLNVEFQRVEGIGRHQSRSFDMKILMRSGSDYTFTNVQRNEYRPVFSLLSNKNVTLRNATEEADADAADEEAPGDIEQMLDDGDSSSDESYRGGDESSDVPEEFDEDIDAVTKRKRDGDDDEDATSPKRAKEGDDQ